MADLEIKVDINDILRLGSDLQVAKREGLRAVLNAGKNFVSQEAPRGESKKLAAGAFTEIVEQGDSLMGSIGITAISEGGPTSGVVHLRSGGQHFISLLGIGGFDYPGAVGDGSGLFGPYRKVIGPTASRALIIPVKSVPTLQGKAETYIDAGGKQYIIRRYQGGQKPNGFIDRAVKLLEGIAQSIFDRVLDKF